MKGLLKQLSTYGVRNSLRHIVFYEFPIYLKHMYTLFSPRGKALLRKFQNRRKIWLHLACGNNYKYGWINVDLKKPADLLLDLREPLPFRINSVEKIYTEHFLEHLAFPRETMHFLQECYRILKPGANLYLAVPDHLQILRSLVGTSRQALAHMKRQPHPTHCSTLMDFINQSFRQEGQHQYTYDYTTLKKVLIQAGFTKITLRPFDPDLDSQTHDQRFTLYVKAKK